MQRGFTTGFEMRNKKAQEISGIARTEHKFTVALLNLCVTGLLFVACSPGVVSPPHFNPSNDITAAAGSIRIMSPAMYSMVDTDTVNLQLWCDETSLINITEPESPNAIEYTCHQGTNQVIIPLSSRIGIKKIELHNAGFETSVLHLVRVDQNVAPPLFTRALALMNEQCSTCHQGEMSPIFRLDELTSEASFVAQRWVLPGEPGNSPVYQALQGAGLGGTMPLASAGWLPDLYPDIIADWINAIEPSNDKSQAFAFSCNPNEPSIEHHLRRLTKAQLQNTLRDWLAPLPEQLANDIWASTAAAFELLPDDTRENGFGRSDKSFSLDHLEAWHQVATLVGQAIANSADAQEALGPDCGALSSSPLSLLTESFNDSASLTEWMQSGSNNSLQDAPTLFSVANQRLTTSSPLINIHSHLLRPGSDSWSNYTFKGQMQRSAGGIGVTFYSDYPNSDTYFRLRASDSTPIEIAPHSASGGVTQGTCRSGVMMAQDVDYRFKVEVAQSAARAKMWPVSETEPTAWLIEDCSLPSPHTLAQGTIGVWSMQAGTKTWDNFSVVGSNASGCDTEYVVDHIASRLLRKALDTDTLVTLSNFFSEHGWAPLISRLLMRPEFMYHVEIEGDDIGSPTQSLLVLNDYELANRLSYHYWDTMPDDFLWSMATQGSLKEAQGYETALNYVLGHDKAIYSIKDFVRQWLQLDKLPHFAANPTPSIIAAGPQDILEHLEDFRDDAIEEMVDFVRYWVQEDGTFADLFMSSITTTQSPLVASVYEIDPASDTEPLRTFPQQERVGLLGRAALHITGTHESSPIHFGAKVQKRILCNPIPTPDASLQDMITPPTPDASLTQREQIENLTNQGQCASCHSKINPLGFAAQNIDAFGRFTEVEEVFDDEGNKLATHFLDTQVENTELFPGDNQNVTGLRELSEHIVESGKASACVSKHYFNYTFGRADNESLGGCDKESMRQSLTDPRGTLKSFLKSAAELDSFKTRRFTPDPADGGS
jgi:hypothetical protein